MSVFVKKFVEKAFQKKHAGFSDSLEPDDVSPHLVFHYGIPSGSVLLAYDSIQQILAISTKDGQIKLFGKDGSQALLNSPDTVPGKFLLFIENQGILLHVNISNHIEVWDLDKKCLSGVHHFDKEITSFTATRNGVYLYVGDSTGDIAVLRLHQEPFHIEKMNYSIPLSASHGKLNGAGNDVEAKFVLPQPTFEMKRVLITYSDGAITLWGIQESKVLSTNSGGTIVQSTNQDAKKVTAACWACPFGTKAAVGYSNGDIILYGVPSPSDSKTGPASQTELCPSQLTPMHKLNLGYKADKIPIAKLKWVYAEGKLSRLYVLGLSEGHSANLLQVVLLNEYSENRMIKLGLHLPESLCDMEIATGPIEQNKNRSDFLLLLRRSGHAYTYSDALIERYLVQSLTKSSPSLPKEVKIKLPYGDSSITVAKFFTSLPCLPGAVAEDFNLLAKNSLPFFPFEKRAKEGYSSNSSASSGFLNVRNLLITGHSSGAINFWDASCPILLPVASITQQGDNDLALSGVPLTTLHFSYDSHLLISGDQSGMVRIYTLKSEVFSPQCTSASLAGSSKKGSNNIIRKIKTVKVNGAVLCLSTTDNLKQLAVGSDQGYVSLVDLEGSNILYQKHIASEFCTGIISTHFETCSFHGFEKNVIVLASKDSSFLTLEKDTGNTLSSGIVRPNKPSKALFTRILGSSLSDNTESKDNGVDNLTPKQSFVLLCSEKAVYAYSFSQLVQGVKKVVYKKKFSSSCHWASTFGSPDIGLILLFATGKIEIRSLPELSLVKESSIRALTSVTLRPSSFIVSSSPDGDLIIVNGNRELLFISTLLHREAYRHVESVSKVLEKDNDTQGLLSSSPVKEKKKGIFGSLVKDNKGSKTTNGFEWETRASGQSIEELTTVFSAVNFPTNTETEEKKPVNDDQDFDLDIDDIDIEDPEDKPRGNSVMAGFNRQNITIKFQAIKGKLRKVKNDKAPEVEEPRDEQSGDIDQIKKKYGYASTGESSVANAAKAKLGENLRKLKGISMKTTEMQDTARSFSSMAKEVLRFAENDKKSSSS